MKIFRKATLLLLSLIATVSGIAILTLATEYGYSSWLGYGVWSLLLGALAFVAWMISFARSVS